MFHLLLLQVRSVSPVFRTLVEILIRNVLECFFVVVVPMVDQDPPHWLADDHPVMDS